MISRELREAIQKIEKLQDTMKNIHLLDLLPEIFENQKTLIAHIEKIDKIKNKDFKERIETKETK